MNTPATTTLLSVRQLPMRFRGPGAVGVVGNLGTNLVIDAYLFP